MSIDTYETMPDLMAEGCIKKKKNDKSRSCRLITCVGGKKLAQSTPSHSDNALVLELKIKLFVFEVEYINWRQMHVLEADGPDIIPGSKDR